MISVKVRLDGHDATLATQGKWLSGYEDELGEHDGAIAALQKIAKEVTDLMKSVRIGLLVISRAWVWIFRPMLLGICAVMFGGMTWVATHLGTIIHASDKLTKILSQ